MLLVQMPKRLHSLIKEMSKEKMTRVMDMMKVRIRFHSEIQNHKYLFEDPDFKTDLAKTFLAKIKQSN